MTGERPAAVPTAPIALAALLAILAGCDRQPPETRYRFTAMGTLVEVTIYDFPAERAEKAARQVETMFLGLQQEWDPWDAGALAKLNAALSAGGEVVPEDDLTDLLSRASRISAASGGAFDPTVGGLVRLWGFHDAAAIPVKPPSAESIQSLVDAASPLPRIWDEERRVLGPSPGTTVDLGAFAKGEAVDRAVRMLRGLGIEHAIVNAGGDLRAVGRHGSRPWKIGIREPRDSGILAAIEISGDESVFTSGDYERYFDYQGRRYHHVLDPRTGYPTLGVASVTIISTEAATADAACTAIMVAGPRHWPAVAAALGMRQVMLVEDDGRIQMTPAMQSRVQFLGEELPPVVLRETT